MRAATHLVPGWLIQEMEQAVQDVAKKPYIKQDLAERMNEAVNTLRSSDRIRKDKPQQELRHLTAG